MKHIFNTLFLVDDCKQYHILSSFIFGRCAWITSNKILPIFFFSKNNIRQTLTLVSTMSFVILSLLIEKFTFWFYISQFIEFERVLKWIKFIYFKIENSKRIKEVSASLFFFFKKKSLAFSNNTCFFKVRFETLLTFCFVPIQLSVFPLPSLFYNET